MPLQEKVFTLGNIVAGHFSLDYNTTPVRITNAGGSDLTINAGDPLTETGIATSATGLLGLATEFRIIPAGQNAEVMVLDFNYGFGVRLNESMLPDTITTAIKTALISKGFKFLP
jgi:hypothetical protein